MNRVVMFYFLELLGRLLRDGNMRSRAVEVFLLVLQQAICEFSFYRQ